MRREVSRSRFADDRLLWAWHAAMGDVRQGGDPQVAVAALARFAVSPRIETFNAELRELGALYATGWRYGS